MGSRSKERGIARPDSKLKATIITKFLRIMSAEWDSSYQGQLDPPQQEGEIWVSLEGEQRIVTRSEILKNNEKFNV